LEYPPSLFFVSHKMPPPSSSPSSPSRPSQGGRCAQVYAYNFSPPTPFHLAMLPSCYIAGKMISMPFHPDLFPLPLPHMRRPCFPSKSFSFWIGSCTRVWFRVGVIVCVDSVSPIRSCLFPLRHICSHPQFVSYPDFFFPCITQTYPTCFHFS